MKFTLAASFLSLATFPSIMVHSSEKCFTGNEVEVNNWCTNNNCCVAMYACTLWSKDAIVTMCEGSCIEDNSCWRFGGKGHTTVHSGSCIAQSSCIYVGQHTQPGSSITIGSGSCIEFNSCHAIAEASLSRDLVVTIGDNACIGEWSCWYVARSQQNLKSLTISANSCKNNRECYAEERYTNQPHININGDNIVRNFLIIRC